MRGWILAAMWIITMVGIGLAVELMTGCAGEGKRERWQDCAGVSYEECRDREDSLTCEYQFYKECINEESE